MAGTIPDWSTLPHLPLAMIAERLRTRIDTLRFRAVCNSFRSAVSPPPKSFSPYSDFECYYNTGTSLLHFVVTESTVYAIQPLSEVSNATQTWLIKVEEPERGTVQLQYPYPSFYGFSALTNISEKLPPSLNLLDYRVKEITKGYNLKPTSSFTEFDVKKVVISTDEFVLMALIANPQQLVAWRSGSKEGSKIDMGCFGNYCIIADIIYHNKKFYVLNGNGDFIMVDPKSLTVTLAAAKLLEPIIVDLDMVKSSNDLLLTIFDPYCKRYSDIFKLDEEKHEWIKMKDGLEDKALFLGVGDCNFSVSDKELPGCKWNSVLKLYSRMTMIYNLGNNTCVYYPSYYEIFWPPPTWIFPQCGNCQPIRTSSQIQTTFARCYKSTKAEWNSKNEATFIRLLHDHVLKGELQTSTFSKKTWTTIRAELFTETNHHFTSSQLKSKFNRIRKKHREFSELIAKTGFGWNPDTNIVTASNDVWKEYLKTTPSAKQFRRRGVDHYNMLGVIFNTTSAIGARRFSLRQMPLTSDDDCDVEDNFRNFGVLVDGGNNDDDDDYYYYDDDDSDDPVVGTLGLRGRVKRPRRVSGRNSELPPRKKKESMDNFIAIASEFLSQKISQNSRSAQSLMLPPPKDPLDECLEICETMGDVPKDIYFKFLNVIVEKPDWRKIFLRMPDNRRREWLSTL